MRRLLRRLQNQQELNEYKKSDECVIPNVVLVKDNNKLIYNVEKDWSTDYLQFHIISGGTIVWQAYSTALTKTISYSKDDGETWTSITSATGSSAPSISVNAGDKVLFKGDNAAYASSNSNYNTFSGSSAYFNVYGNIMSLINSTGFTTATTLSSAYTFYSLFNSCKVVDASNLFLPAITLTSSCYQMMFAGCTSLTSAPELPATTLATSCYSRMFSGCTSLITSPELPATTLAQNCYYNMFYGCTSLTSTPAILPATTLAYQCYSNMFEGCTSLTSAPELPATTLAERCYAGMFRECINLATAPTLPSTILSDECYQCMFQDCSSLTNAPELPATTLADGCYRLMFLECTSLTTAPELPSTTLAEVCYFQMFAGCTSLNYIKCLAINMSAEDCTMSWTKNVASSGIFVKNRSANWSTGENGIPTGWEIQNI